MKFNNILINGPKEAKNILLLAHGAGAPMDSMFMDAISNGLNNNGIITLRFEFPYMQKRRSGKNTFPDMSLIPISEPTRRTPISYGVFCLNK